MDVPPHTPHPSVDFKREQLRMLDLQEQQLLQEISSEEKNLDEKIERRKAAILQIEAVRKATSAPNATNVNAMFFRPTIMLDVVTRPFSRQVMC